MNNSFLQTYGVKNLIKIIKSPTWLVFLDHTPPAPKPGAPQPGRWGAAASAATAAAAGSSAEAEAPARLMPFLVQAAEAPSYASVALVKPESTGSHRWTKKEAGEGADGGVVGD